MKKNNREKIIYFALKYKGNWQKIYDAFKNKEEMDDNYYFSEMKKINYKVVTIIDDDYPSQFKTIYQPPFALFYYGNLSLLKNRFILGVVGSREASEYGKKACCKIIDSLKDQDVIIVSGLAKGIDGEAHQSAINNNLKTVAVLGTGIDYCYPKENLSIYQNIKKNGLLISEYPYKEVVSKNSFVLRNRLIAALSSKLLIPEVKEKSGTLITIRFGIDFGKEILVVPSSIFLPTYNNQLIYQGATPIMDGKDIFE